MNYRRAVVLSPHSDDGELAAGGTVAKLREAGVDVTALVFSTPGSTLPHECEESWAKLGVDDVVLLDFQRRIFPMTRQAILQEIWDYNEKHRPDLVLAPSTNDWHQDHEVVCAEAIRTFKAATMLGYEFAQNCLTFKAGCFVSLEQRHMDKKLAALKCYTSQQGRPYFSPTVVIATAVSKGVVIGVQYAEAFEAIRMVM